MHPHFCQWPDYGTENSTIFCCSQHCGCTFRALFVQGKFILHMLLKVCLHSALISAPCWLPKIWQFSQRGATGGTGGWIQTSEMRLQALSPFCAPLKESPRELSLGLRMMPRPWHSGDRGDHIIIMKAKFNDIVLLFFQNIFLSS